ncbi:LytR/AlgR family response regulator transcription factor [Polaribacter porphyrae]|uniref:HTH LytTR-type domain-containing protein n=1 Tax=Polaribacter porphyrae TaxID=1137780 RepID=A0A2S7WRA9_9FLAO|nr:LytTR family DNA-binding domain-containing protein [Polaribacter porphyrae]PQJ80124.1 hypothetical protein BTO18_13480 [Polaribacter porphyrae]
MFVLFIIFFLKPFDTGTSTLAFKEFYFLVYGVITFFSYLIFHFVSSFYYSKVKIWRIFEEIILCLLFVIASIIISFYYTEIFINNKPERVTNTNYFFNWFKIVFLGFGFLLFFSAVFLRRAIIRPKVDNNIPKITINDHVKKVRIFGSLKKSSFLIDLSNLAYIKSENNYVTIFYFEEDILKEKLFRCTLTNIKKQLPYFLKVHRSYIINPAFIISLKGNKQNARLYLKNVAFVIPVSAPFFEVVYKKLKI